MSLLVDIQTEVEECRAQAGQLAEHFVQQQSEVEANPSLTIEGKHEIIDPLYDEVSEKIAALHSREKQAVKTATETLERQLFGLTPTASANPNVIVSYRDAVKRARSITDPDEAKEEYDFAIIGGDTTMVAAILHRALVNNWLDIKNDYLQRNPSAREPIEDLQALARYSDKSLMHAIHYVRPQRTIPAIPPSATSAGRPLNAISPPKAGLFR